MTSAPGATMIVPSSPASRPRPPGGLRPAWTPAAGGTGWHLPGAGKKVDQQTKIRLTDVSTVWGDCQRVRGERMVVWIVAAALVVAALAAAWAYDRRHPGSAIDRTTLRDAMRASLREAARHVYPFFDHSARASDSDPTL